MFEKIFSFFGKDKKAETATTKTITNQWFPSSFMSGNNTSGETVTQGNALTLSTVYACVNVISQDIAKVPFYSFQKTDSGKQRLNNKISQLLNYRPNPYMSAMDFRQALTAHCLTYGNAYAEIQRDINNEITALWILPPDKVKPVIDENNRLIYEIKSNGRVSYLFPEEVLHLKGLGFDGLQGYSVIAYASQSLGSALAQDKFAGSFFGNGATMGGYLEHPNNLSSEAQKRLLDSVERRHLGADKAHRILVLEEGMKFQEAVISPEDSQLIQSRQFNISEICRWFRVPPHKVSDLSKATFSNIEQQSLEYVTDTLSAWFKRWEQEVWFKLFTEEEKEQGYYAEHVLEALLRGDITTRYSAYAQARQWGWLSVNDIRRLENMNDVEGGDTYLVPMNMIDANTTSENTSAENINRQSLAKDIAERIGRAELRELDKQINREDFNEELFSEWEEKFYVKHNEYVRKTLSVFTSEIDPQSFTLQKDLDSAENKQGFFNTIKEEYINRLESKIYELIN